jgi:hypothetical protein
MPSSTIVTQYAACIALALFQAGEAAADELWRCTFTKTRLHWGGRDLVVPSVGPFFLHVQPPTIDIGIHGTATRGYSVPISYTITENSRARLAGIVQYNLSGGVISTGKILLERRSGRITQSGYMSDKSRSEIAEGVCSKTSPQDLPPSGASAPPADVNGGQSSPQPEVPMHKPPLVRKRPA